ncbi:hypothetical protein L596_012166 [Steinernema carpocapsae]|uniref:Uncharacterized protein n=1 Tax=Steinernema carpocapsae TaxID=34508 RepID=A0A4U5NW87_STECR|nr:hypothetical protein L596_012166 [Steinernema carpocapsae]
MRGTRIVVRKGESSDNISCGAILTTPSNDLTPTTHSNHLTSTTCLSCGSLMILSPPPFPGFFLRLSCGSFKLSLFLWTLSFGTVLTSHSISPHPPSTQLTTLHLKPSRKIPTISPN